MKAGWWLTILSLFIGLSFVNWRESAKSKLLAREERQKSARIDLEISRAQVLPEKTVRIPLLPTREPVKPSTPKTSADAPINFAPSRLKQEPDSSAKAPATLPVQPLASPQRARELEDPVARVALALVGIDPAAEDYWVQAIFDPTLPDKERDDLMEDLNEEGFPDPHHPGPDDIPVILARLDIIEQVAPEADDFMRAHLAEAYKDLVNMLDGRAPQ